MASNEVLANLVVELQAQTSQYQARLDQADARMRRFQRQQNSAVSSVAASFKKIGVAHFGVH